jgi:predicted ABC-type ATPase
MAKKTASAPGGTITVLAGVNGAGKSSVAGAYIRAAGGEYYNPDDYTRTLLRHHPGLPPAEANSLAWARGRELLEQAIAEHRDFVFETTLGGKTMPRLLARAAREGMAVKIFFVGLASVDHHLRRVAARVALGGHDIPAAKIRERWDNSRLNLIRLLPFLRELMVWDNSAEVDFATAKPAPVLRLHLREGEIIAPSDLASTPDWAKPIVAAACKQAGLMG